MDFRPARESELPLIWQALKGKAVFPNFEELKTFQKSSPALIQVSRDTLSCLGIIGSWRMHSNVGAIKALIAPTPYKKLFLQHLVSVLRKKGFQEIISPPLRSMELHTFYELGFRDYERIAILKRTRFSEPLCLPTIDIREFNSSYLSHLVKIEEEAFSSFWQLGQEELASLIETGSCFVAFFKDTIIGYNVNTINEMNGTVARLAVLPKYQGKGFGSQLLSHAVDWFGKGKVKSVFVCTQFENRSAQKLYTKFGFAPLDDNRYILLLEL